MNSRAELPLFPILFRCARDEFMVSMFAYVCCCYCCCCCWLLLLLVKQKSKQTSNSRKEAFHSLCGCVCVWMINDGQLNITNLQFNVASVVIVDVVVGLLNQKESFPCP